MASVKKSAIQSRQGHPTGIIDDTAKAFGRAIKKGVRKTETKVYKKVEKAMLNREVRKQVPRKLVPSKDDRAFYRAERAREINELGGPFVARADRKYTQELLRQRAKPAVKKYPSKEDASGRMSQQKPNLRGKMIKPAKPGAKSGAVQKPYKMVPAVKPAAKGKRPVRKIAAVKPKRKGSK